MYVIFAAEVPAYLWEILCSPCNLYYSVSDIATVKVCIRGDRDPKIV